MMNIFRWFDAHCAWIYNNTNVLQSMLFGNHELPVPMMLLKCVVMGIWYFAIIILPLIIIARGVGYIIGGWTGTLHARFVDNDD